MRRQMQPGRREKLQEVQAIIGRHFEVYQASKWEIVGCVEAWARFGSGLLEQIKWVYKDGTHGRFWAGPISLY